MENKASEGGYQMPAPNNYPDAPYQPPMHNTGNNQQSTEKNEMSSQLFQPPGSAVLYAGYSSNPVPPQGAYDQPPVYYQQPSVIIQQQPASNQRQLSPQNVHGWTTGICGCCEDCESCCIGCFCPCYLSCMVASRLRESCLVPMCCLQGGCMAMRTKLRIQAGIRGDIANDGWCTCCCMCCMLMQMMREMKNINYKLV